MIQDKVRKGNSKIGFSPQSTDQTNPQTLPQQSLKIPDFFCPVPISVLTSPEYNQLRVGVRDCFVRMCIFRNTKDRYTQRVIHQKTGQTFDLWDGTLQGRLTDRLVQMMELTADTVRSYIKELVETGFLHECPRWKKIGNTRRYVISHYQDQDAIQKYLDMVIKVEKPNIEVVQEPTKKVEPTKDHDQTPVNTSVSFNLDNQSKLNSSSSNNSDSQLQLPVTPDTQSQPIPLHSNLHQIWKSKTGKVPSVGAVQSVLKWGQTRFDLSQKQFETALIKGLQVWDGLHPDGGYVEHITWVEKDNRAYDGTTGDWLITTLEAQGWKRPLPKPKLNTDSVLEHQQLTESSENIEATRQKVEQDQQRKLQHQHDIEQGIVKPMPDDLQKRINLLGNRK
jgi:hypothetical protein